MNKSLEKWQLFNSNLKCKKNAPITHFCHIAQLANTLDSWAFQPCECRDHPDHGLQTMNLGGEFILQAGSAEKCTAISYELVTSRKGHFHASMILTVTYRWKYFVFLNEVPCSMSRWKAVSTLKGSRCSPVTFRLKDVFCPYSWVGKYLLQK